jgi:hypothetical protein
MKFQIFSLDSRDPRAFNSQGADEAKKLIERGAPTHGRSINIATAGQRDDAHRFIRLSEKKNQNNPWEQHGEAQYASTHASTFYQGNDSARSHSAGRRNGLAQLHARFGRTRTPQVDSGVRGASSCKPEAHQEERNSTLVASRPATHGFARKLHGRSSILVLVPSSAFIEIGLSARQKFSPLGTKVVLCVSASASGIVDGCGADDRDGNSGWMLVMPGMNGNGQGVVQLGFIQQNPHYNVV